MNFLYTNIDNMERNPLYVLFPKRGGSIFETLCNEPDKQPHLDHPVFRAILKNLLTSDGVFEENYIASITNNLNLEHFKNITVGENTAILQNIIKKLNTYENVDYVLMYAFFTSVQVDKLNCSTMITRSDYLELYNLIIKNIPNKSFKVDLCKYSIGQYLKSFPMIRTYQLVYDEKNEEILYNNQDTLDELDYDKLVKITNYAKRVIMLCWPLKDFDVLKNVLDLSPYGFNELVYFETLSCNSSNYIDVSFIMKCLWYVVLNDDCNCSETYYILSRTAPISNPMDREMILRFAIFECGKLWFRMPYQRESIDEALDKMEQFGTDSDFYIKLKEFEAIQYYHDTRPCQVLVSPIKRSYSRFMIYIRKIINKA
ncbi:hypothetical protein KGM_205774 [Danaus plexippus plexippus]|uniref:Uncharacterized protein n=1 Tax=Danaus plexippus plexippus TaxID=278856 RepID=A0A212FB34_DANPL|nr:hypothetical protein KGM_205774 [Danaus plexippus plexippus]